jgi:hypothetical protein
LKKDFLGQNTHTRVLTVCTVRTSTAEALTKTAAENETLHMRLQVHPGTGINYYSSENGKIQPCKRKSLRQ